MTSILQDLLERTDATHPFPEDGTDEDVLNWHRRNVWTKTKQHRLQLLNSGITVYGKLWQTDERSRAAIQAEALYTLGGYRVDGEVWYSEDNSEVELSNQEFLGISVCLKSYLSRLKSLSELIRFEVYRLATVEECHNYDYKGSSHWPSSIFDSIPSGWTAKRIPFLVPIQAKIDHLEHEIEKIEGAVDAIPKPTIADATNTRLRLYPSPRKRDDDYWVYIRIDNDVLDPEKEISLHKVRLYLDLDKAPTSSSTCKYKKLTGNTYSLTPNAQEIKADKKMTMSLKFVNTQSVVAANLKYA